MSLLLLLAGSGTQVVVSTTKLDVDASDDAVTDLTVSDMALTAVAASDAAPVDVSASDATR